jgi:chromate reductase
MKILAVSGSLRAASYNTALLHAARELAPGEMVVEVFGLGDLPFFNQDVEDQGAPPPWPRGRTPSAPPTAC